MLSTTLDRAAGQVGEGALLGAEPGVERIAVPRLEVFDDVAVSGRM